MADQPTDSKFAEGGVVTGGMDFTDRYQALGMRYPDPLTVCNGECEGTGVVPVFMDTAAAAQFRGEGAADNTAKSPDETDPELVELWKQAESLQPADDGWHFVRCPTCKGSGKRPNPGERTLAWVTDQVRGCHNVQAMGGNWNFSPYMRGMFNGLELALSILEGGREPQYRDAPADGYLSDRPQPASHSPVPVSGDQDADSND